jgi:hypothetical protein
MEARGDASRGDPLADAEEGGDVWKALDGIFADMDARGPGSGGEEHDALADTVEALRGLLDMHAQLRSKSLALAAKRVEIVRERDAALDRLARLTAAGERGRRDRADADGRAEPEAISGSHRAEGKRPRSPPPRGRRPGTSPT